MKFNEKYIPVALLTSYTAVTLLLGKTGFDISVVIASLVGLTGMFYYVEKHKKIQDLEDVVKKQNEVLERMAKEIAQIRTSVVGVKLATNVKTFGQSNDPLNTLNTGAF